MKTLLSRNKQERASMKKIKFFIIVCFSLVLSIHTNVIAAARFTNTFVERPYIDESIVIESTLTISIPDSQLFSATRTISATKTYTIKSKKGKILAAFSLDGTFEYDNKSAACINATYHSSNLDTTWYFSSKSAWKSGNKAIGEFTAKNDDVAQTISETITLTCHTDGTVT